MTKRLKPDSSLSDDRTSPPNMPPPPPPKLSSLPPEIRNTIYRHLFSLPNIQADRLRTYRSNPSITLNRPVFAAPTALFLTSRQIGSEARKVFYADNLLACISIDGAALSTPVLWLLKTLPLHITWSLLDGDAPDPLGCLVRITHRAGGYDRLGEDAGSHGDGDAGGGGGKGGEGNTSSPSSQAQPPPEQSPQKNNNNKNKNENPRFIIASKDLNRLCREWRDSELTLDECVFSVVALPVAGWGLGRLSEWIWHPLCRLSRAKSVRGPEVEGEGYGRVFYPVRVEDRTGVFDGIVFTPGKRNVRWDKLWRRWEGDPDTSRERARGAEQRRGLAMRRAGRTDGSMGWVEDETSGLAVGKMAERLVREMMSEGSEEDGKLDLAHFLGEVAREEGG